MSFKVIDKGWNRHKAVAQLIKNKKVEIGVLNNNKNMAYVAFLNEYGHKARDGSDVPERSFMRATFKKYHNTFVRQTRNRIIQMVNGNLSTDSFLNQSGEFWQQRIKSAISEFHDPANKASTVKRKGFNDPLIHTGLMLSLIKFKIRKR